MNERDARSGLLGSGDIDWNACIDEEMHRAIYSKSPALKENADQKHKSKKYQSAAEIIDKFFKKKIRVSENGTSFRLTIYEAIVQQLYIKAIAGDAKAVEALRLYGTFGNGEHRPKQRLIAEYIQEDGRYIQDCGFV